MSLKTKTNKMKKNDILKDIYYLKPHPYGMFDELIVFLFVFLSFFLLVMGFLYINNESVAKTCNSFTPEGYSYTHGYGFIHFYCNYESLPSFEYKTCYRKWKETDNHGEVLIEDTCTDEGH